MSRYYLLRKNCKDILKVILKELRKFDEELQDAVDEDMDIELRMRDRRQIQTRVGLKTFEHHIIPSNISMANVPMANRALWAAVATGRYDDGLTSLYDIVRQKSLLIAGDFDTV